METYIHVSSSFFSYTVHHPPSRPGTEDVVVLKKELVSVQTLMDKMALELEKEKNAAQAECEKLKEQMKAYVLLVCYFLNHCKQSFRII